MRNIQAALQQPNANQKQKARGEEIILANALLKVPSLAVVVLTE